ncbi:SCP [Musa troglodytarum]|uniref:SCP n=1 Tax=Musa troglodytarum TaxID=320322 RepID=A0A9E7HJY4_9LILI|nr:SCP [Musa troglodytarum]
MAGPMSAVLLILLFVTPLSSQQQEFPSVDVPQASPAPSADSVNVSVSHDSSADAVSPPPVQKRRYRGKNGRKNMVREFLHAHNQVRAVAGEKPFAWDDNLARYAKRWSEKRRSDCAIVHSMGPYGENMFWGSGWDWRVADAVENWAREHLYYNRSDNSCMSGKMCGHFTQIVWNSSEAVGCARVECFAGGVIITCNYDPPGNWVGESPFGSLE